YEFKAAINGAWDENYGIDGAAGGDNIPLMLDADAVVTFHYDRATSAVWATVAGAVVAGTEPGALAPAPSEPAAPASVSFPGTIGAALGGADWAPDDAAVQAADQGDGTWTLTGDLPAGSYEFKAAINGTWDENYGVDGAAGGDNIPLTLADAAAVTFHYDRTTNAVWATVAGTVVAGAAPAE
ncbi:MAG: hypothetical protein KAX65_05900, partial [Caldilineaceae bacterium]|nr:hypothetical protein [Caldilineaceae bacterium]